MQKHRYELDLFKRTVRYRKSSLMLFLEEDRLTDKTRKTSCKLQHTMEGNILLISVLFLLLSHVSGFAVIKLSIAKRQSLIHHKATKGDAQKSLVSIDAASSNVQHLRGEFENLCRNFTENKEKMISRVTFMNWEEIQALLSDNLIDETELGEIWQRTMGRGDSASFDDFLKLNSEIDALFEINEDDDEIQVLEELKNSSGPPLETQEQEKVMTFASVLSAEGIDPWDTSIDIENVLEPGFVVYLREFFDLHATPEGLSFESFSQWKDVLEILEEGSADKSCLEEVWAEALRAMRAADPGGMEKETGSNTGRIGFGTFCRLNLRLERLMDDIDKALSALTQEDTEGYLRAAFQELSRGTGVIAYPQLRSWEDICSLLEQDLLTEQTLEGLWAALPKQPLGYVFKENSSEAGSGHKHVQSEGIAEDAFLVLNAAIDDAVAPSI